ncbi:MAG: MBL fold metallo-hydrolase [Pirellulaceae bacterium]
MLRETMPRRAILIHALILLVALTGGCQREQSAEITETVVEAGTTLESAAQPSAKSTPSASPFVVVLGTAQDAGYPQAGCNRECCRRVWYDLSLHRDAACLAIVDPISKQRWMFECTPDFREQLQRLDRIAPVDSQPGTSGLTGIFLTHAHIGHYTGLIHLGHEAIGARGIPVFAMPRMANFLRTSGPWSQLVEFKNIELRSLQEQKAIVLNDRIRVTPILVPHRDEFSETVAFRIEGPKHAVLFLPDIDKWDRWDQSVEDVLKTVDRAYVDGTFFDDSELPHRSMAEIPHPFIVESMKRFAPLSRDERHKIRFIHLNHTNPAHDVSGKAVERIIAGGYDVARQSERFDL